jgi:hypothetical protein
VRSINKGAIAALTGSAVALIGAATPAFAQSTTPAFTTPSDNPHTIPVDNNYNALPFDIAVSGYPHGTNVFVEICDGQPIASGWNPTLRCDNTTSPSPVPADVNGNASFPASNVNEQIGVFNGISPGDVFNCLSLNEIQAFGDATPGQFPGEWTLGAGDTMTATGQTVDPNQPAWTNCLLRASSNNATATTDQIFDTLTIPSTFPFTPEAPVAILLPLGAAGLLAGGLVFGRRRRAARVAA